MKKINSKMRDVAEDIIGLKFTNRTTFKQAQEMFYSLMRKHGIKQGTKAVNTNGIIGNNFEWTMAKGLFISRINSHFDMADFFSVPKDLKHY